MRRKTEWITIRRRTPLRRLSTLAAYSFAMVCVVLFTVWLTDTEPRHLDSQQTNPVTALPPFIMTLAAIGALFFLVPLLRRPLLQANHFGVKIRPSFTKTLVIPWSNIEEIAAITVSGGRRSVSYLLLATDTYLGLGDRPRFSDRSVLREANRATEGLVAGFDVAIRCEDFHPSPDKQLAQLASYAPGHVRIVDRLS
ncbi:hypothetical protein [Haloglycomyces albus]|uniref:hypothetical protein n=1 Tax=Haloglycomyces albus TaxID=526067 RepID=UPI00046CBB58|nr:hypothetical protein [Haloglycomyces albus]